MVVDLTILTAILYIGGVLSLTSQYSEYSFDCGVRAVRSNACSQDLNRRLQMKVFDGVVFEHQHSCLLCGGSEFERLLVGDRYDMGLVTVACQGCFLCSRIRILTVRQWNHFTRALLESLFQGG